MIEPERLADAAVPDSLVCVCPEPTADPLRNFGMCRTCKRKPIALMEVK